MTSTLKKRLITAGVLLPLVILGVLFLPLNYFMVASAIVFLGGAWEWTRLSGLETVKTRLVGFMSMLVLAIGFYFLYVFFKSMLVLCLSVLVFWSAALCMVLTYPKGSKLYASYGISLLIGVLALGFAYVALISLKAFSSKFVLYVMVLVWAADTGAYFAGKRFGKHKLAREVSPGKTWEGVLGAFVLSTLVSGIAYFVLKLEMIHLSSWIFLSLVTVFFSIVGDLFESLFKRLRNLKDSGTLLPGHGGILDRLDSLIAALPIFIVLPAILPLLSLIVSGYR